MGVVDILTPQRVFVAGHDGPIASKTEALRRLATLLSHGRTDLTPAEIEVVLVEREKLQSTGVGGGVAVPHGVVDRLDRFVGALVLCPDPIDFEAIDQAPVSILFGMIGPKAPSEHIRTLARVSRFMRSDSLRERLLRTTSGREAFDLIAAEDRGTASP